mmetsp:Transcript_67117/g.111603  ORF Transcript_67117/g.111603 Transcript_67117/m.111603 type:complete len:202 (-) Transcript_67117:649-1254(-)
MAATNSLHDSVPDPSVSSSRNWLRSSSSLAAGVKHAIISRATFFASSALANAWRDCTTFCFGNTARSRNVDVPQAFSIHECLQADAADGRSLGSFCKRETQKSRALFVTQSMARKSTAALQMLLESSVMFLPLNGRSPDNNMYATTPIAQTSDAGVSGGQSCQSSGAMNAGVPARPVLAQETQRASPKSINLSSARSAALS